MVLPFLYPHKALQNQGVDSVSPVLHYDLNLWVALANKMCRSDTVPVRVLIASFFALLECSHHVHKVELDYWIMREHWEREWEGGREVRERPTAGMRTEDKSEWGPWAVLAPTKLQTEWSSLIDPSQHNMDQKNHQLIEKFKKLKKKKENHCFKPLCVGRYVR